MSTTDRPTSTYPTNPFAGWRDRTPTGELPPVASPVTSPVTAPVASQHEAGQAEPSIQDMWRPRSLPAWHPSLMQLAIGAIVALLAFISLQHLALDGISDARRAAIEQARATPAATAVPSQDAPSQPDWVTEDTHAPYSKDDPAASPLDLPRCTTAPDTPLPCLASHSSDGSRAVVLEEDASLTGLERR